MKFYFIFRKSLERGDASDLYPQLYVKFLPEMYENMQMFHHVLTPLRYCDFSMRITRSRKFTPWEKLLKPFDKLTWLIIAIIFIGGYLTTLALNILSNFFENVVFRTKIRDPYFSFIQTFFGIGLVQTPNRNFMRFIFMMITILFLILRTVYQSKMFDFLQYDIRQPDANSLEEIVDKQIPVMFTENFYFKLNNDLIKCA